MGVTVTASGAAGTTEFRRSSGFLCVICKDISDRVINVSVKVEISDVIAGGVSDGIE